MVRQECLTYQRWNRHSCLFGYLDIMYLLIRVLEYHWRDRTDVYLGGNMFIYFDPNQQKNRNFRGPDFFVVKGVTDQRPRHSWVIWEEEYRTPEEEKFIEAIEAELFAESESAARG